MSKRIHASLLIADDSYHVNLAADGSPSNIGWFSIAGKAK